MNEQNEGEERRMLPVQDCFVADNNDYDCPYYSFITNKRCCECALQKGERIYVEEDYDDEWDEEGLILEAREELFRTCPLPKAGKKEGE